MVIVHCAAAAKSLQSCPTLCDPTDGSPPGSPVPGILQAGTLEWAAIAFSELCTLHFIYARDISDMGSIPGSRRSPGEGSDNPLQYSCLQNPMDRGNSLAIVHRFLQRQTQLKWLRIARTRHMGNSHLLMEMWPLFLKSLKCPLWTYKCVFWLTDSKDKIGKKKKDLH